MKGSLSKGCRSFNCRKGRKPWHRTRSNLRLWNRRRYGIDTWNRQEKQRKIEERMQQRNSGRRRQSGRSNKGNKPCIGICQHYRNLGLPNPYA